MKTFTSPSFCLKLCLLFCWLARIDAGFASNHLKRNTFNAEHRNNVNYKRNNDGQKSPSTVRTRALNAGKTGTSSSIPVQARSPANAIVPYSSRMVVDAADLTTAGGYEACNSPPSWIPGGQIAGGIGQSAEPKFEQKWEEKVQVVPPTNVNYTGVRLFDIVSSFISLLHCTSRHFCYA